MKKITVGLETVRAIADFINAGHAAGAIDDYNGACLLQYLRLNYSKLISVKVEEEQEQEPLNELGAKFAKLADGMAKLAEVLRANGGKA